MMMVTTNPNNQCWYPDYQYSLRIEKYLSTIEQLFMVLDANRNWTSYNLTPHQREWHSQDVAILEHFAKNRVATKSRNTSFTVSSIISNLMDVPKSPLCIRPFVRLNITRAQDLIGETKEIIKNMNVVLVDGEPYPFDKTKVQMDSVNSIKFPNGVEFRAFPANSQAAEVIRGLRIVGSAGVIDECNFMKDFKKIYIALRDAASGSVAGQKIFQMNIGTTRKGRNTAFNLWYEEIIKNKIENVYFFNWAVVDPTKVNLIEPLTNQNLKPIVPWHTIHDLEQKRKEDLNTFKEEYMAELVDSEEQLYNYAIVEAATESNLQNSEPVEGELYNIGIDPATSNHFFAVSIFEKHSKVQKFLYYTRNVQLATMEQFCRNLILKWKPVRVVIDGNGLGFQISQTLKNEFGNIVKVIRGISAVKTPGKVTGNIPMKEYLHTNMIKMFNYNEIKLIPDEMQMRHYMMWQNNYDCVDDANYGHGDIVIANGFALLPDKWKHASNSSSSDDALSGVVRVKEHTIDTEMLNKIQEQVKENKEVVEW